MNAITFNYNGKPLNELNIHDIESMNEEAAFIYAYDTAELKDHTLYFVDFGGYYGFSVLVFAEGKHIYYCDDFQLHHSNKTADELKEYYIESLKNKIFTADELKTVSNYDDYTAKDHFIRNYYPQRFDHASIWFIGSDEERAARQKEVKQMFYCDICFSYFHSAAVVDEIKSLYDGLQAAKNNLENCAEYWKDAFLKEMYNHEYNINWQADYDVISAFANLRGVYDIDNINTLFAAAKFSELQKSAYMAARAEYCKESNY